jgi:hypothetical protein
VHWRGIGGLVAVVCLCAALDSQLAASAEAIVRQRDGTLAIAGRSLRCGTLRNVLDSRLPNLGLAAPGVVVFNPRQLNRWSDTVRLFVYHHECGHHHVGGNELAADCWAVKQGVRDGWLTRAGLGEVCRSFGNGPATSTHPSGARRCASLDRCFRDTTAVMAKEDGPVGPQAAPAEAPKLLQGPTLKRSGMRPLLDPRQP